MITKEQFIEWKTHPVTQAFMAEVTKKEKEATELLIQFNDDRLRGLISAFRDIKNVEFDDVEEE